MKNNFSSSFSISGFTALLALLFVFLVTVPGHAQYYKVYGYETTKKGEFEGILWNSYAASSQRDFNYFGKTVSQKGLWAHALEVEYGLTERLTLAARADFLDPKDAAFRYVGARAIFMHYRFGNPGENWFDPAILLEYSFPRSSYNNEEELELRVILERKFNEKLSLSLNPIFKLITSGHGVEEGLEFGYAAGIYYKTSPSVQPGLELFGEIGQLRKSEPFKEQEFYIFPSVNLHLWELHWNLGAGFGLTKGSNDFTLKSILSYGF